jgi:hypothetical protein
MVELMRARPVERPALALYLVERPGFARQGEEAACAIRLA